MNAPSTRPQHHPPAAATLQDLLADLVWPSLLRAGSLALRPARLGLAFFFIVGVSLLAGLGDRIAGGGGGVAGKGGTGNAVFGSLPARMGASWHGILDALLLRDSGEAARQLYKALVILPAEVLRQHPLATVLVVPPALWLFVVVGGAISRTAATEIGLGSWLEWPKAVGFAVSRWATLMGAVLVPLLVGWGICLGLAVGGWALFNIGVLGVVGGAGWVLFLIGGSVAGLVLLAYVLGHPLLVASVACESSDALDAVQHSYALVFARPLRLVVYALILVAQAVVIGVVVSVAVGFVLRVSEGSASVWVGERGAAVLHGSPITSVAGTGSASGGAKVVASTDRAAAWLVNFWNLIPAGLVGAFFVSYYWCANTLLFLGLRRVADGQDFAEIWMPGLVEGTMAEALSGRGAGVVPAPGGVPPGVGMGAGVREFQSDNGPADET